MFTFTACFSDLSLLFGLIQPISPEIVFYDWVPPFFSLWEVYYYFLNSKGKVSFFFPLPLVFRSDVGKLGFFTGRRSCGFF